MRLDSFTDRRSPEESRRTITTSALRLVNKASTAFGQVSKALTAGAAALVLSAATVIFISAGPVRAQQRSNQQPGDLTSLSLDQLLNIEVNSVSKKEEKLFRSEAAVY